MFPALRKTLAAGREFGALGALVSGSGPTCFFLARDERHATDIAVALSGAGVCRSVAKATGAVAGRVAGRSLTASRAHGPLARRSRPVRSRDGLICLGLDPARC